MPASRVEMRDVTMAFGAVRVLHGVDISVEPGEVHALVGQNGAGKSTLMKILGGIHPNYGGEIYIDGELVHIATPREGLRSGVEMIHQELSLIPTRTVAENLILGDEPGRIRYSRKRARAQAAHLAHQAGALGNLPLDSLIADLGAGMQQRVEIAKAVGRNARVLVMDEPTARLSVAERLELQKLIRELAGGGLAIVYISHFLEEVFECTDRLTVLRNGRVVAQGATTEFDHLSVTRAMLNEELLEEAPAGLDPERQVGVEVLRLENVSTERLHAASLELRAGEILGIAGLVGSGRTRLGRAIGGADPVVSGTIYLKGERAGYSNPRQALAEGIALVAEDRKSEGVVGPRSAADNLVLMGLDRGLAPRGIVKRSSTKARAREVMTRFGIHPEKPMLEIENFSGGNQQKILLGRAVLSRPSILVVDQPTAGVDIGAKAQIHRILREVADEGAAIVVISDDLEEILALSTRVAIMRGGKITGIRQRAGLDRTALITEMAGGSPEPIDLQV